MSTVLEIEKAIEKLPTDKQNEIAEWFDQRRFLGESSAALASSYDDEDGGESQLEEGA